MGRVRPFTEEDIPRIIELNIKLFPNSAHLNKETQHHNFSEICFRNPWHRDDVRSLVYENESGKVVGFIGVIPRQMSFCGKPITAAVCQHMMVDPEGRSPFAGLELFRAVLAGPQELSFADMSKDVTRRLWERCGGSTAFVYSTYWKRLIRPMSFIATRPQKRKGLKPFVKMSMPLFRLSDAALSLLPMNPFHKKVPSTTSEDLSVEMLLECIERFSRNRMLRPSYDTASLKWLIDVLTREQRWGSLQKMVVRNSRGDVLGWYIYHLNRSGPSEVLQVGANDNTVSDVLDHLFYDAWTRGAIELEGRLKPDYMKEFTRKYSIFIPGRDWMLVHSNVPGLLAAIYNADAWLTRLEGDLWFF